MNAIEFTPDELAAFRAELFQGFSDSQFNLAIAECKRRNLVPGQHVFFQLRNAREWNADAGASVSVKKLTKVTTVDAFRLISQRTGEYAGQGKPKFYYLDDDKNPSIVSEIPLPHPSIPNMPREPWAASIPIYRKGFVEPVEVVCRFDAYAVTRKMGDKLVLTDMWQRRGPEQILKCSECAARRAAFPEELGSMFLREELEHDDPQPDSPASDPTPKTEAPKAAVVPQVNHAPAIPTNEPRPSEKPTVDVKDVKIEDVILDKVEVKGGVSEPEITVHVTVPVQKMDNPKSPADRCRELIDKGVAKNTLKDYSLRQTGTAKTSEITKDKWDGVLTPIETLLASGGKEAVNQHMADALKPVEEKEEVF